MYLFSDQQFITIVDYNDPNQPFVTNLGFDYLQYGEDVKNIAICEDKGLLMMSSPEEGLLHVFTTVKRSNPNEGPKLLQSIDAGKNCEEIITNSDCTIVAVSNINIGEGLATGGVTIVRSEFDYSSGGGDSNDVDVVHVPLDALDQSIDDEYVLTKGLNLPLSKKSLEYWDEYSPYADDLDLQEVRENYRTAIFLTPTALSWNGPSETEILVNLQENNGIIRIDINSNEVLDLAGFGLKDHGTIPIDINTQDQDCILRTYKDVFSMRNPNMITSIRYNDKIYLITSNEGESKEYDNFEDLIEAKDLFKGTEFFLNGVDVDNE